MKRKIIIFVICMLIMIPGCKNVDKGGDGVKKKTFTPVDSQTVQPADIFSDGVILQRNNEINIFGTAINDGAEVTVSIGDNTAEAIVDKGKWCAKLNAMDGGYDAYKLTITSNDSNYIAEINDVLIGEVWFYAGQSNMNLILQGVSATEMNKFSDESIRQYRMPMPDPSIENPENGPGQSKWLKADGKAENGAYLNASAIAHFCSKDIKEKLDVPVGAVVYSCGNTLLESFMNTGNQVMSGDNQTAGLFYSYMDRTIIPFTFDGVVWYQGESNVVSGGDSYNNYATNLEDMISQWRTAFGKELPFIIIQLPLHPTKPSEWGTSEQWDFIKNAQSNVAGNVDNTYLVKTDDIDKDTDLHPTKQKIEVGQRCADVILSILNQ
ncbi:MAG: sialate O-acetylesterase [Clostridiales bacterium]|jgi:sialate O-acetylesterase|nr:sialate O-acetylesterase [Clostridiales bacterium]